MYQIDVQTASTNQPPASALGTVGYFTDGNLLAGIAPTVVPAEWLNAVMLEMLAVVTAGGIAPSKVHYGQMAASITAQIGAVRTAVQVGSLIYAADIGIANAYRANFTPAITVLIDGMQLGFQAINANTGAATFAPNGVLAKPLIGGAHTALQGGEIVAGSKCLVMWHAGLNSWVLLESTGAAVQVGTATASSHAVPLAQAQAIAHAAITQRIPKKKIFFLVSM